MLRPNRETAPGFWWIGSGPGGWPGKPAGSTSGAGRSPRAANCGSGPARWDEFRARYCQELAAQGEQLDRLRQLAQQGTVTLLFAAKDEAHNNAVLLQELLE